MSNRLGSKAFHLVVSGLGSGALLGYAIGLGVANADFGTTAPVPVGIALAGALVVAGSTHLYLGGDGSVGQD